MAATLSLSTGTLSMAKGTLSLSKGEPPCQHAAKEPLVQHSPRLYLGGRSLLDGDDVMVVGMAASHQLDLEG
jgi:hypothetical protein